MDTSPIVHELTLTCTPDHAFEVFTSRIGEWWDPQYSGNPETFSTVMTLVFDHQDRLWKVLYTVYLYTRRDIQLINPQELPEFRGE